MFCFYRLCNSFRAVAAVTFVVTLVTSAVALSQDADTQEIQNYMLTQAALTKYMAATKNLAALPQPADACDADGEDMSITQFAAKLEAEPDAKSAITSAGMSVREYVVFSFSLLQTAMAAWVVDQPGGQLPPDVSQANVDFYKNHAAEIESASKIPAADCADEAGEG